MVTGRRIRLPQANRSKSSVPKQRSWPCNQTEPRDERRSASSSRSSIASTTHRPIETCSFNSTMKMANGRRLEARCSRCWPPRLITPATSPTPFALSYDMANTTTQGPCWSSWKNFAPQADQTVELRARMLEARGNSKEAVSLLLGWIKPRPNQAFDTALLLEQLGELAAAEEVYRKHAAESRTPQAALALAGFLARRNHLVECSTSARQPGGLTHPRPSLKPWSRCSTRPQSTTRSAAARAVARKGAAEKPEGRPLAFPPRQCPEPPRRL